MCSTRAAADFDDDCYDCSDFGGCDSVRGAQVTAEDGSLGLLSRWSLSLRLHSALEVCVSSKTRAMSDPRSLWAERSFVREAVFGDWAAAAAVVWIPKWAPMSAGLGVGVGGNGNGNARAAEVARGEQLRCDRAYLKSEWRASAPTE